MMSRPYHQVLIVFIPGRSLGTAEVLRSCGPLPYDLRSRVTFCGTRDYQERSIPWAVWSLRIDSEEKEVLEERLGERFELLGALLASQATSLELMGEYLSAIVIHEEQIALGPQPHNFPHPHSSEWPRGF